MFTLLVFCITCYIGIRLYNKRNFKLFRKSVWRHPILETKSYIWYLLSLFLLIRGMYFVLGMKF